MRQATGGCGARRSPTKTEAAPKDQDQTRRPTCEEAETQDQTTTITEAETQDRGHGTAEAGLQDRIHRSPAGLQDRIQNLTDAEAGRGGHTRLVLLRLLLQKGSARRRQVRPLRG